MKAEKKIRVLVHPKPLAQALREYCARDHTPALFDPAKTAMLKSYRLDRAQGHGWEFEVVDPRNLHGHA